ncbi:ankyrin repeat domain-containing protein [Ovoidimarina sediminis]|uniref:ankyrin repeat domain-containing protein n=1 Tax=Ovoidimarina sediminis TaxID=3079856 RepID=UPI00290DEC73|nr:ankyrin repeat domain-containing protein [Rhodophyticola sp. MJ-SS7]MDU8944419.1 ankyrin repeat domain-containing protein [Rhodophyticola sp. MJ-SS7]
MTQSLDTLRRAARRLKRAAGAGEPDALARIRAVFPDGRTLRHADALHIIAREEGFDSWPRLKAAAEIAAMSREARAERLKIALFYGQHWVVERLLAEDPDLPEMNLGLQIALYREDAVTAALARDPGAATSMIGVRAPILHLAFSHQWKHHPDGPAASIHIAERLVAHGADVNDSYPAEEGSVHRLSALYGALGHAGNVPLARWLLQQGANPNDNESLYHSTELGHTEGLKLLLEFNAKTEGTNALLRAMDFDDAEMVRLLLEAGADPNEGPADHPSGQPPVVIPGLHQAARRMCSAEVARLLIAHGADGTAPYQGHTAYALARMRGNRAVAQVLEEAGQATPLDPSETLLAEAADGRATGRIEPSGLTDESRRMIHRILGYEDPLGHVKRLVSLGLDPNEMDEQGMPAIHIAAWEGHADVVAFLLDHAPDLAHRNIYGGDLMGTVIHGAEFCPARARRDHLGAARLIWEAGSPRHRHDITHCGVEDLAALLEDWAEEAPERVVNDTD